MEKKITHEKNHSLYKKLTRQVCKSGITFGLSCTVHMTKGPKLDSEQKCVQWCLGY